MKQFDKTAPIPQEEFPQADAVTIVPADDPLVCLSNTLQDIMLFEPRYYLNGIGGAIPKIYVRKTVMQMLLEVANALPSGYRLKIFDAWRPAAVQKSLFNAYYDRLRRTHKDTGLSEEALWKMTLRFVSYPSEDPNQPFVHATGGAVDLTIVDETGNNLEMGTDFDDFSDAAHTAFFENSPNHTVRDNRRLLYNAMLAAGFTNFPSEWWHYDFGDRFWAAAKQTNSLYPGIYTEPAHP